MKTNEISCEVKGGIGVITLQRPKVINALNRQMCAVIDAHLQLWQADVDIKAVVIQGAGERGFCAGGDIRFVYEHGPNDIDLALDFFQIEYQMNRRLFHFTKPYIALLHGVTMGGGLGVSVHGSHRVAAKSLMMAMPETGIGFYPDIGASYFLPRLPGKSGWYLGLTGAHISADDAYYLGLVDYVIDESDFAAVIEELCAVDLSTDAHYQVSSLLKRWALPSNLSQLTLHQAEIDRGFSGGTPESIFENLRKANSPWCEKVLQVLQTKSPTSLAITCQALLQGAQLDFDQCMAMELRITEQCLHHPDFYEGVRAAIIDKDRKPRWVSG